MRAIGNVIQNCRTLTQSRGLIVLLIAVALVGINRGPSPVSASSARVRTAAAITQGAAATILTGTFQVMNSGPGDQFDPHVDCNMASYTNDDFLGALQIRFFDFSTNTDHGILGNGADSLSEVYGGRIVFTEATASGPHVIIFNTATQTRSVVPGFGRSRPRIGGNLMAFEDRSFFASPNQSEIGAYDLSTGTVTRLTNDSLFDKNPAVSPTGDAIVWEKCQTDGFGCDIYASIQTSPGVFTTRALTGATGEDHHADTNGQIVVYISDRGGETDIYLQPLTGGAETQLSIPGNQRGVNISGDLIAFESEVVVGTTTEYDVFVYDLSTGTLYQITNTPVDETLSDISVCNGIGRIVYSAPATDYDVWAFTFQLPSSAVNQVDDLIELIESFNLPHGIERSLITKLQDALAAIGVSDTATACDSLTAFINEARAQSGKKLTADQSSQLINSANQIKTDLGCQ